MVDTANTTLLPPRRMTAIIDLVDLTALPPILILIGRMISQGYTQTEIAARLNTSPSWVAARTEDLRRALARQALESADELAPDVRDRLQQLLKG